MNESHTPIRWNNILAAVERTEAYKPIFPFISGAPDGVTERETAPPHLRDVVLPKHFANLERLLA